VATLQYARRAVDHLNGVAFMLVQLGFSTTPLLNKTLPPTRKQKSRQRGGRRLSDNKS
jgi:hypothetical protein